MTFYSSITLAAKTSIVNSTPIASRPLWTVIFFTIVFTAVVSIVVNIWMRTRTYREEIGTLRPGQYFSIFKMPDGRTPRGSPSRETIPSPSFFLDLSTFISRKQHSLQLCKFSGGQQSFVDIN